MLVGEYAAGDSSIVRPPPIPFSDVLVYDSCVDNVADPQIFVTFDSAHSYPSYVITYDWPRSASAYSGYRK